MAPVPFRQFATKASLTTDAVDQSFAETCQRLEGPKNNSATNRMLKSIAFSSLSSIDRAQPFFGER